MSDKKKLLIGKSEIKKIQEKAVRHAVRDTLVLFMAAMHDEGADDDMLLRTVNRANRYADAKEERLISIDEVLKIMESAGIHFERDGWI